MTSSSFIISMYAGTSAMSKGRSTNRSVLMEMSGKVDFMRSSMPKTVKGTACSIGPLSCMGGSARRSRAPSVGCAGLVGQMPYGCQDLAAVPKAGMAEPW